LLLFVVNAMDALSHLMTTPSTSCVQIGLHRGNPAKQLRV